MSKRLSLKQQKFADLYLINGNATEAYIQADYKYKNRSVAEVSAHKLLRNAKVQEYIECKLMELQSEKVASIQEVLEYLTSAMRREQMEMIPVTLKNQTFIPVKNAKGEEIMKMITLETVELIEVPTKVCDANTAAKALEARYRTLGNGDKITVIFSGDDQIED